MSIIKHAVISAAGMGTRLGINMPKCLLQFSGVSIIKHQLELLKDIEDIRVVVGFMEEDVINVVKSVRNDAVFVRNPHYQDTSNTYSISLATKGITKPHILLDGDLLINKKSFKDFVYTELNKNNEVIKFDRKIKSQHEWSGICCLSDIKVSKKDPYLFQILEKHLPLPAKYIECSEIDTADDLKRAQHLWPRYFA